MGCKSVQTISVQPAYSFQHKHLEIVTSSGSPKGTQQLFNKTVIKKVFLLPIMQVMTHATKGIACSPVKITPFNFAVSNLSCSNFLLFKTFCHSSSSAAQSLSSYHHLSQLPQMLMLLNGMLRNPAS